MSQGCVLKNLDNPLLSNLSLGLTFSKEQDLGIAAAMFPCCAGNGFEWDNRLQGYHSCHLKARMARLGAMMHAFNKAFPNPSRYPYQVTPAWSNQILVELASVFRHDKKPTTISYTSQRNQPSLLWSKAFAAIWRFGMDVRIGQVDGFDAVQLTRLTARSDKPYALFVDQVDKLWDPAVAEAIEMIVQQAYNAQAFLWIEFVHEQASAEEAAAAGNLKEAFARRVKKLKDKHPLDLLSRDCLSRLQSMSGQIHQSGK